MPIDVSPGGRVYVSGRKRELFEDMAVLGTTHLGKGD